MHKYDFELEYAPGKTMLVSDTFSRSYLNDNKIEFDENTLIRHVHFILSNLPISQSRLDQFLLETQKDQILQTLICYTINGWPEKHQVPKEFLSYYSYPSDITYHEGIPLRNQRIIVPTTLRSEMNSIIHKGHFGLENPKKRARQVLFWPLTNSKIVDMIKSCPICLNLCNQQPSEPTIKYPVPQTLDQTRCRLISIIIPNSLPSMILKIRNPLPLLTSVRKYFRSMVFPRN